MLLREFLDDDGPKEKGMMDMLRQQLLDYLTPLVAHEVAFVSIHDIADTLRNYRTGLTIDRGMIMELIDPDDMKVIKKIEGDKVYLDTVQAATSDASAEEKERDEKKIKNSAAKQAKKELKK